MRLENPFATAGLLWRGFLMVWKSSPSLTLLSMLIAAILAFNPLAHLWITKQIIDMLTRFASRTSVLHLFTLGPADLAALATLLAAQMALWVGVKLLESLHHLIQQRARSQFELRAMRDLMRKCEELDLAYFESPENTDRLEKAMRGSLMSAWNVLWMLFDLIRAGTQALSLLLVLILLNPLAPLVVIACTLPQVFASAAAARARYKLWNDHSVDSRLLYYFPWLVTEKNYVPEVKFFSLTKYIRDQYEHYFNIAEKKHSKIAWTEQVGDFIWSTVSSGGAIAVYVYICVLAFVRLISTGDAVLYMGAVDRFQGALRGLFSDGAALYEHVLYLKDLFDLMDQDPRKVPGALAVAEFPENAPRSLQFGLEFRNVSFKYPYSDKWILRNVSFKLDTRQSVALVGKNGAGKSTMVKLILRLYDPTEGSILVDGRDLRDYDLNSYREMCSVMFQDFCVYALTMRENIGFGDIENIHDTPRVEAAATRSGADQIIKRMPKGLEGHLTKHYVDDGEELSGGEWQKVGLARALMRTNAQIIILDEPTAALDAFAEHEMFNTFRDLTRDRLSILISHRFSTVSIANKIIVIDEGKLIEEGCHEELMSKAGLYSEMYRKQADRYK